MCTDSGAYMANFKMCFNCRCNELEVVNNKTILTDEGSIEITTFERN